jgi:hypothetical protein
LNQINAHVAVLYHCPGAGASEAGAAPMNCPQATDDAYPKPALAPLADFLSEYSISLEALTEQEWEGMDPDVFEMPGC